MRWLTLAITLLVTTVPAYGVVDNEAWAPRPWDRSEPTGLIGSLLGLFALATVVVYGFVGYSAIKHDGHRLWGALWLAWPPVVLTLLFGSHIHPALGWFLTFANVYVSAGYLLFFQQVPPWFPQGEKPSVKNLRKPKAREGQDATTRQSHDQDAR